MIRNRNIEQQSQNSRILLQGKSSTYMVQTVNAVENYVKIIHPGLSLQCKKCEYSSIKSSNLKRHIETHNKSIKTHDSDLELKCKECEYKTNGRAYVINYKLKMHMHRKHGHEKLPCGQCEHTAHTNIDLRRHIRIKHSSNEYTCPQCEYKTNTYQRLHSHKQYNHTERFIYSCDECNYTTKRRRSIGLHKQCKHEGLVWPCKICPFKAARPVSLRYHMKSIHTMVEPTMYSCDECTWKTRRKRALEIHKQSKHDGVVCPCDTCPYTSTNPDSLKRHKRLAHSVDSKVKSPLRCKTCPECKTPPCGNCAKCLKLKRFGGSGKSKGRPCLYLPACKQFEPNEVIEKARIKTEQLSECKEEFSNNYEIKLEQEMS